MTYYVNCTHFVDSNRFTRYQNCSQDETTAIMNHSVKHL